MSSEMAGFGAVPPQVATAESATGRRLSGGLGVGAIVFMVIAAAGPLTVVGGGAPVGILMGNGAGYPALFLLLGVIFLLFSVGLSAMTRRSTHSGAFFSVIGQGLGPIWGAAGAYLALLTYLTIQISVYAFIGLQLTTFVATLTGVTVPWWIWSLAIVACVGLLGYRHIDLSSRVLGVLLILEVGVVLVLSLAVIISGGAAGLSLESFTPSQVFSGNIGVGIMFAAASFVGFESTAIYRHEARDPDRTVPRATYLTIVLITAFYVFATWALVEAWGVDQVISVAEATLADGNMLQLTGEHYLGAWYSMVISVLIITSMFACVLSFHNVLTRYYLSMSRAGLLPKAIGRVSEVHHAPSAASLLQTALPAVLIVVFAVGGLDPYAQVFTWFSGVATQSFLVLMAVTCFAVLWYFARGQHAARRREGVNVWQRFIAPALGLLGLVALGWTVCVNFPMLVGDVDSVGSPMVGSLTLVLLGLVLLFPVIGAVQAAWIGRRSPQRQAELLEELSDEI